MKTATLNKLNLGWAVLTSLWTLAVCVAAFLSPSPVMLACCVASSVNSFFAWNLCE